jgi:hypothetical protein
MSKESFLKKICLLLLAILPASAMAGDLWEIVSTSVGPDGSAQPYTQKICFSNGGMDPSQMLGGLGSCTFDQKNGNVSAMTFSMTCKTLGMPAGMESMKVAGDARLNGDRFDMRYTIALGGNQAFPGGDFTMAGSLEAHKVGQCSEH